MIRFGMNIKEIAEQLIKGFFKVKGRMPTALEKMKIEKETLDRYMDMRKVMDMKGNQIDPSKSIMGGTQEGAALKSGIMKATGAKPRQVLSEDEIRQKLLKNNEERIASMKSKLDDPEKKAMGGRIGYKSGTDFLEDELNKLRTQKGVEEDPLTSTSINSFSSIPDLNNPDVLNQIAIDKGMPMQ